MRFPKPRPVFNHGKRRWLVYIPKAMGGGRQFFQTEDEAKKKVADIRKTAGGAASDFTKLKPKQQNALLHLLDTFNGDADKLREACELGRRRVAAPMRAREAVAAFYQDHKFSEARLRSLGFTLRLLVAKFGDRNVGDIEELEIGRVLNAQEWGPKMFNECRQAWSQFWKYCVKRRWSPENPVTGIASKRVLRGIVPIYTPDELRTMLTNLATRRPLFIPLVAIGGQGGVRIAEISRLNCEQIWEGIDAGQFEIKAWQTKTGQARWVPVVPALKAWLVKYLPKTGPVLPMVWKKKKADLKELGKFITRLSGIKWKPNALRHSFGTYRFKVTSDASGTISEMGTSVRQFDKHYFSRAKIVTAEAANAWFEVVPTAHD